MVIAVLVKARLPFKMYMPPPNPGRPCRRRRRDRRGR